MSDPTTSSHERRLAELERRVAELEAAQAVPLMRGDAPPAAARGGLASPAPSMQPATAARADKGSLRTGEEWYHRGEGWLGRAGVALLVLGLIFLFRYAVDQGWLTPVMRVATGVLMGGGLLGAGLLYFAERPRFRQILMGGGVIILFISGLAASELYQLVSGAVTLLFHGAVAVAAFTIAARQRDTVMASIAATGALLPPALLLQDAVAGPVLWFYLLLMASWAALLAARHGPGPYAVVAPAAAVLATLHAVPPQTASRAAAVAMLAAVWLGFAALPLLRARLAWARPYRAGDGYAAGLRFVQPLVVTLALAGAVHAFVWPGPRAVEAALAAAAAGFALLALYLIRGRPEAATDDGRAVGDVLLASDDFAAAATAAGASLALLAVAALDPSLRFVAVAAVATAAFLAAPRLRAPALALLAHALYAAVATGFLNRIESMAVAPAFDTVALGFTGVLLLALVMLWRARNGVERIAYAIGAFAVLHVLLASELGAVPGAPWLGSASYALVGSALVVVGLARQQLRLQQAGLLSLGLLVLRLFAYDLAKADTGVRIVLFLACGAAFLGLSYLFRGRRAAD
jgi:hypothetical protein